MPAQKDSHTDSHTANTETADAERANAETPNVASSNGKASSASASQTAHESAHQSAQQSSHQASQNTGVLNREQRANDLRQMKENQLDVLIIGGGIVGAGAALDASTRALNVGIVEARDWASGTSSRSSKLVHGGLRYLEMLDFKLVFEALKERGLLMKTVAPHLVKPITFLYPLQHRIWERCYVGAGIMLYDFLAFLGGNKTKSLKWHKHYSKKGARTLLPGLSEASLKGAIRYSDGQVDDARLTLTAVRTAVQHGAKAANQTEVLELIKQDGAVIGAKVHDKIADTTFDVFAKRVILSAGVWTEDVEADDTSAMKVHASKGIHLVIDKNKLQGDTGMLLRTEKSVLFVIPWRNFWIVGTTDTPWTLEKEHPAVNHEDVTYLLEHVNAVLETPITEDDVIGIYAGLRPLVSAKKTQTTKISREHSINQPSKNLYSIAGGKLTTYRVMAKDIVDAATKELTQTASRTKNLPLLGAQLFDQQMQENRPGQTPAAVITDLSVAAEHATEEATLRIETLTNTYRSYGIDKTDLARMMNRYGNLINTVLEPIIAEPELATRLISNEDYLLAEAAYAVTHEGANHLDDVLTRRTRIYMESEDRGAASAQQVADLMATLLNWTEETVTAEVDRYLARVKYERLAQQQLTDAAAEEMRLKALKR